MPGRILRSEDFERVLAQPAKARSAHFAVHFASGSPSRPRAGSKSLARHSGAEQHKLSTVRELLLQQPVDDQRQPGRVPPEEAAHDRVWLGTVVPKRHARRAVTRNLIKRQIRGAAQRLALAARPLAPGLWVVRLRLPFDRAVFASGASAALRDAARRELDTLLSQCGSRDPGSAAASPR